MRGIRTGAAFTAFIIGVCAAVGGAGEAAAAVRAARHPNACAMVGLYHEPSGEYRLPPELVLCTDAGCGPVYPCMLEKIDVGLDVARYACLCAGGVSTGCVGSWTAGPGGVSLHCTQGHDGCRQAPCTVHFQAPASPGYPNCVEAYCACQ